MTYHHWISALIIILFSLPLSAQDGEPKEEKEGEKKKEYAFQTFKTVKIVNMPSTETLTKRTLDMRIWHKFGDIGGGWETFGGLENATDIAIGFAYGVTDDISVGIFRSRGSNHPSTLKRNLNGTLKYRFLKQGVGGGSPLTMTFSGMATLSTGKKSANPEAIQAFSKFSHRLAYSGQLIIGRKFGERFSLQIAPGYLHRNIVPFDDTNSLFYLGMGGRFQISKVFGIIGDINYPFSPLRTRANGYYPSTGIGLEMETGGHVFQVNFTNTTGIMETDYIPYTQSTWGKKQFRLAFMVTRTFNL